jgi:hypothetical protein
MNYTPIPHDFLEEMGELSDAEYGRLVRWGQEYMIRGTATGLSGNERFYAKRMQMQLDRYKANYEEAIEQKRAAGRASAERRRLTALNGAEQRSTDGNEINKTKTKTKTKTNTETNDNGGTPPVSPPKGGDRTRFQPPTLDEVIAYCRERNSSVDPRRFYDYFTAGGWVDGQGQPVRNWKQKLITWEGRKRDGHTDSTAQRDTGRDWGDLHGIPLD